MLTRAAGIRKAASAGMFYVPIPLAFALFIDGARADLAFKPAQGVIEELALRPGGCGEGLRAGVIGN